MRRNYTAEAVEIILALAVIALTVVLFIKSDELTILYPIVFALAAVMCVVYALEGVLFRRNRMVRKSRIILFLIAAAILLLIAWLSLRVVY